LVTAALCRRRTRALRQVLVQEALGIFVKITQRDATTARPSGEMRDAAEVSPCRTPGVPPLRQIAPIPRYERRQRAVAEPRCRLRANEIESVHAESPVVGSPPQGTRSFMQSPELHGCDADSNIRSFRQTPFKRLRINAGFAL